MHRLISYLFSQALSVIHFLVIAVLVLAIFFGASGEDIGGAGFATLLAAFVGYLLFAGVTSVIICIHENIARIATFLDSYDEDREYDDEPDEDYFSRTEPPLKR